VAGRRRSKGFLGACQFLVWSLHAAGWRGRHGSDRTDERIETQQHHSFAMKVPEEALRRLAKKGFWRTGDVMGNG
jgi:hypothetical protein